MYKLLRPLFFRLDPEAAHEGVTRLLAALQAFPPAVSLLRRMYGAPSRPVKVAGLRFANPVGLAAGFDKACRLARVLPAFGFGFLELGTVTWEPQSGNPRPRIFRLREQEAILNRLGFNNPGAEEAAWRLGDLKDRPVPIGINIGKSARVPLEEAAADYERSLDLLHPHGDYFVLNISSPNTADLRRLHERARLESLLSAAGGVMKRRGQKPLFVKVSPDLEPQGLESLAQACVSHGAGIVVSNTTVSREGLPEEWREEAGGVSGKPLREPSTRVLRKVKELTGGKVPLIGVGGIFGPQDAKEKFAAGADLVQVYTGWVYEGPGLVRRIVEGLGA